MKPKPALILVAVLLALSLVVAGCESDSEQATQRVDRSVAISTHWQTITLENPFRVDHRSMQRLHIAYDPDRYQDNFSYLSARESDFFAKGSEPVPEAFGLRRLIDDVLIVPEVELLAADGKRVRLTAATRTRWWNGDFTVGYDMIGNNDWTRSTLPYPADMTEFSALRIRSNEPITALFMRWEKELCLQGTMPTCD